MYVCITYLTIVSLTSLQYVFNILYLDHCIAIHMFIKYIYTFLFKWIRYFTYIYLILITFNHEYVLIIKIKISHFNIVNLINCNCNYTKLVFFIYEQ